MRSTKRFVRSLPIAAASCFAAALCAQGVAAQSLTGPWELTLSEVSNTCGDPLAPPETIEANILQEGNLVDVDVPGDPNVTEISGVVDGSSLSVGFEVFEDGGLRIHDPAQNVLSITQNATVISGDANWEFYAPWECTGTETWSGVKTTSGTPGDLSGNWIVEVTELSDSCDPPDPDPFDVPITAVQEGGLVDVTLPVNLGQTRISGRVSGQTLNLGLGIREAEGDFSVFDAAENSLTIDPDFGSFLGVMTWHSYEELICTGVDTWVLPEPSPALGSLAALGGLLVLRRWRARSALRPGRE